jgi:hypothetical protein
MELALAAGIVHFGGGKNTAGSDDRVMEVGRLTLGSDDLLPNDAAMAALQQCSDAAVLASAIAALRDDEDYEPVGISACLLPPHSKKKPANTPPMHRDAHLAKKNALQLNLPTTPDDKSAKESSVSRGDVGRWH